AEVGHYDATVVLARLGSQLGAGGDEAAADPARVLPAREPRVAALELERDGLKPPRPAPVELDQEQEPEVVAQPGVDAVVVDEVAEVIEDTPLGAVEDVRGVAR